MLGLKPVLMRHPFLLIVLFAACATAAPDETPAVTISGGDAGQGGDAGTSAGGAGSGGASGKAGAAGHAGSGFPTVGGAAGHAGSGFPTVGGAAGQAGSGFPTVGGAAGAGAGGEAGSGAAGGPAGPCTGMADGAECEAASGPCRDPGVCQAGACVPAKNHPDGEVCAKADGPCKSDGTCAAGVCQPAGNKPDGMVCNDPGNPCIAPGTCSGGNCGAPANRPDAFNYDGGDHLKRCCGGNPTTVTSDADCGGCGIKCNKDNGESCQARSNMGQTNYYCAGCQYSAKCWTGCCGNSYAASKNVCSVSDCSAGDCKDICPSGMHCVVGAAKQISNWCEFN